MMDLDDLDLPDYRGDDSAHLGDPADYLSEARWPWLILLSLMTAVMGGLIWVVV